MQLWCDVGNTRLKWQLCDGEIMLKQGALVHHKNVTDIPAMLAKEVEHVSFVGLASVLSSANNKLLSEQLVRQFGCEVKQAKVSASFQGLRCVYQDITRFGVDRWLAILAARVIHSGKAVCVVDAGSALTLDCVLADGRHLGGYIVPGLQMSINALLGKTEGIRFTQDAHWSLEYGVDTASAVEHGALLQMCALVQQVWNQFSEEYSAQSPALFLTGGDARLLASVMRVNFELHDDLVLRGLKSLFTQDFVLPALRNGEI